MRRASAEWRGRTGPGILPPVGDDIDDKVRGWIESSGRALELRVARTFRRSPVVRSVRQSAHYEDPDQGKQREGDVLASYRLQAGDHTLTIEMAIECKSGKSKPWVAFYDGLTMIPNDLRYWCQRNSTGWDQPIAESVLRGWIDSPQLMTDRVATHVASALGDDSHNTVADAARQALSFARARAKRPMRWPEDDASTTSVTAVVPVVVTQAPLFDCHLDPAGEVVLTRVERFDLFVYLTDGISRRVYVRSEAALEDMADDLERFDRRARF